MKKISIVIPTRNEEKNIARLVDVVRSIFTNELKNYDYEIIITDNKSNDNTRLIVKNICETDKKVKAIFNLNSFSYSVINALVNSSGDCAILLVADFQDPPELIPEFIKIWEKGHDAVVGIKTDSYENPIIFAIRKAYYSFLRKISDVDLIENFSTYALYDKKIIKALGTVSDPYLYLRGVIVEFTDNIAKLEYVQNKRESGKSKNNFIRLYDFAMRGITSYAKGPVRLVSLIGVLGMLFGISLGIYFFTRKLLNWNTYEVGIVSIIILLIILSSIQLMALGLLGEYIMSINIRVMNHPRVIEEERINFDITIN